MTRPTRELRLTEFEWSGFVENHFFENILIGTLAGGLGLILIDPAQLSDWILYYIPLSIVMFVIAFVRIWKTVREEHETGPLWDDCITSDPKEGAGIDHLLDRFFEVPYLFSLLALPFSAIAWQAFTIALVLFYVCDNHYNTSFAAGIAGRRVLRRARLPESSRFGNYLRAIALSLADSLAWRRCDTAHLAADRAAFLIYFERRIMLNQFITWLVLIGATLVWTLMFLHHNYWAIGIAAAVLAIILVIEAIYDPHRTYGMRFRCEPE